MKNTIFSVLMLTQFIIVPMAVAEVTMRETVTEVSSSESGESETNGIAAAMEQQRDKFQNCFTYGTEDGLEAPPPEVEKAAATPSGTKPKQSGDKPAKKNKVNPSKKRKSAAVDSLEAGTASGVQKAKKKTDKTAKTAAPKPRKQLKPRKIKGGRLLMNINTNADGTVKDVSIKENSLNDDITEKCILSVVRQTRFPNTAGGFEIDYPLILRAFKL